MTLCDRLAQYFQARPGAWVDGRDLAQVAGAYAWRSRVSNLRKPPYGMVIENRQQKVRAADGQQWTKSEYRYVHETETNPA